jgi:ADP-heptose:LPS heptosyltransferase
VTGAVLVARLDNAGDVLLAGPAVRAAAGSGRPVHLLCSPAGRAAAELLPGVDGILEWRAPWIDAAPDEARREDALALVEEVRARDVTAAAILTSSHQSPLPLALLLRWAGVERVCGISHDYPGSLLDDPVRGDPDVHEVERGLLVTGALGLARPVDDRLRVRRDGRAMDGVSPPYVVVHPGASVPARTLAPECWRSVVAGVAASGRRVVVSGSREEARLTALVSGEALPVLDLAGRTTLRGLADVIASADALVSGNTGPMHLAAAVGTPVVAVFPPTVPLARWRPWRVPHVVLGDQHVACAGCRSRACPLDEQVCVCRIGAGEVVAALDHLAGPRTGSPS